MMERPKNWARNQVFLLLAQGFFLRVTHPNGSQGQERNKNYQSDSRGSLKTQMSMNMALFNGKMVTQFQLTFII